MIRRRGQPTESSSSEDEEDAFTALSKKDTTKKKKATAPCLPAKEPVVLPISKPAPASQTPVDDLGVNNIVKKSLTSSMKRHHTKTDDTRKAKMDALLMELEEDQHRIPQKEHHHKRQHNRHHRGSSSFVPEKKGSFVDESEAHLTTNIFVGNLAPSITEEDMSDLFSQFGELYSIKIMWPRTPQERSRQRNTGFICFMNRADAEEAMDACSGNDPFHVGRQLMMRWGKSVMKEGTQQHPSRLQNHTPARVKQEDEGMPIWNREKHEQDSIRVHLPSVADRFHFISTVASFVAKDGTALEKRLIESNSSNPEFSFLVHRQQAPEMEQREHIFYRWRVYSFCQGDSYSSWMTEPFVMFHPCGRFWIPPAMDKRLTNQEMEPQRNLEKLVKEEYQTGRQLEKANDRQSHRKRKRRGQQFRHDIKLTPQERDEFNELVNVQLSISRQSICAAMAFCFEKSGAAQEISELLRSSLLDDSVQATLNKKIAKLYLLSDILFNSQQAGVRNAFMYRDALQKMAPAVFTALGKHGVGNVGRITLNKLRNAVSSVLGAWTEWSVYDPEFLDELEARFEGKEVKKPSKTHEQTSVEDTKQPHDDGDSTATSSPVVTNAPKGNWRPVVDEEIVKRHKKAQKKSMKSEGISTNTNIGYRETEDSTNASQSSDGDIDGEAVGKEGDDAANIDGAEVKDDDIDGADIDDALVDGSDIDGEEIDDDIDGEEIYGDDLDGEAIDG